MSKLKRPRIRRVLKWTGLVVCILILLMWGLTTATLKKTLFVVTCRGDTTSLRIDQGGVFLFDTFMPTARRGWGVGEYPGPGSGSWSYRFGFQLPRVHRGLVQDPDWPGPSWIVYLPLWLPFVVLAIPTAFLFWRDNRRRYSPGHCRSCGYNLTGNESGVCPECGLKVESPP